MIKTDGANIVETGDELLVGHFWKKAIVVFLNGGRNVRKEHPRKKRMTDCGEGDGVYVSALMASTSACLLKKTGIIVGIILVIAIIAIAVGIAVSRKKNPPTTMSSSTTSTSNPSNGNLNGINSSSIPKSAQGTYYDPFTWYDTEDFNITYTPITVGGLPIMGLNSSWDDNTQANANVPSLKSSWQYGTIPIRGMNIGGWLSLEPFITPSLFSGYSASDRVIDEYTLTSKLGSNAAMVLEKHYSSFVSEQTFVDIQAAGFDHVRIPYSYWAVTTYPGDPYVSMISWRYLLRGIEWARKYGLRVNLDLHGLPGSQNGWNHSGRQGVIGWLNGTDGQLNADRSLSIHQQLSTFFAQPRYTNIITMYGLANEPRMVDLNTVSVLNWTSYAINTVRASGMSPSTVIVFGDGFMGLPNWKGKLQGFPNILLDVHQYVIFNTAQLGLGHSAKLDFACQGWTQQTEQSSNPATGFGNFLCGEWSQADTDCAPYLNNIGVGSRWEGTLATGNATTQVLTPTCPRGASCSCANANAAPTGYSAAYRNWLLYFAEAQMYSFEQGWGWFYWTWQTEAAAQWSWKKGLAAGTLPKNANPAAGTRMFTCNGSIPDFAAMGLSETY